MSIVLFFILGLCVGSFLNVLIYREACNGEWVFGRSYCDYCKKKIAWYDNIPLLSYVALGGRCRKCRKKIDIQYPVVELLCGMEFVWIYIILSSQVAILSRFEGFYSLLTLAVWLLVGASLLAIFVADLKFQIVPDAAVYAGIVSALFKIYIDYRFTGLSDFSAFWAALAAGLFFVFLILVTGGKGMGWGDVKLVIFLGLLLGWPAILVCLFIAFLTGAIVAVILIFGGRKKFKDKIAFGPFLIAAAIFILIMGDKVWEALKWWM